MRPRASLAASPHRGPRAAPPFCRLSVHQDHGQALMKPEAPTHPAGLGVAPALTQPRRPPRCTTFMGRLRGGETRKL